MLKRLLLSCLFCIRRLFFCICWTWDLLIFRFRKFPDRYYVQDISSLRFQNALFLVPHADDDLIGGWSCQKKNKRRITFFYCGFTGTNQTEGNRQIRRQEFLNYAKKMSIPVIEAKLDHFAEIAELLRSSRFDAVFLPSYLDWHPEHRVLNEMLARMDLKWSLPVIWYSVTVPLTGDACNAYSPMSQNEQKEKWSLFKKTYLSQHMPCRRLKYQERMNSIELKSGYAAEPFYVFENFAIYQDAMRELQTTDPSSLNRLCRKINRLCDIRSSGSALWKYRTNYGIHK